MIADDREGPIETALKMITAPVWVPIYLAYVGCRKLAEARADRKAKPETAELKPVWVPKTDLERAVYAALLVAGKPVTNDELARLLRLSKGETSSGSRSSMAACKKFALVARCRSASHTCRTRTQPRSQAGAFSCACVG